MASTKQKYRRTTKGRILPVGGLSLAVNQVEKRVNTSVELPDFKPGDTVKVYVRIKEGDKERLQAYEGIVIARKGTGINRSFNVRKISHGVGVERIFMDRSPKIGKLEIVQVGKVRRAKLNYLRRLAGKAARVERGDLFTSDAPAAAASGAEAKTASAPTKK